MSTQHTDVKAPAAQAAPDIAAQAAAGVAKQEAGAIVPFVAKPIDQMSEDELKAFCKDRPAEAAGKLSALMRMNTAMMSETVFVKRNPDMTLQKVRKRSVLRQGLKEITTFKVNKRFKNERNEWQDNWVTACDISAIGYRTLNQTAGLHVFNPPTVVVDGRLEPNPCIIVNEKYGKPEVVLCRKVVVGPARDTGNLVASDVMVRLDLRGYLLETLNAKMARGDEKDMEGFAEVGFADDEPDAPGKWKFYSVDEDTGFWFNITHKKFRDCLREHQNRLKFAERIAQTVAERNAYKAHPAMPASVELGADGLARVEMVGWVNASNLAQLARLKEAVEQNKLHEIAEVRQVTVEKIDDADRHAADEELEAEKTTEDVDVEASGGEAPDPATDQRDEKPRGEKVKPEAPSANRAELLKQAGKAYQDIVCAFGPKQAKVIIKQRHGIDGEIADATDAQLSKLADDTPL